jgi:Sigma-70 region 2
MPPFDHSSDAGSPSQPCAETADPAEGAHAELLQVATDTAVRVSWRHPLRADFIDEAPALVFFRLDRFDPDKGTLRRWCHRVLRRAWIDRLRRQRSFPGDAHIGTEAQAPPCLSISPSLRSEELTMLLGGMGLTPFDRVLLAWVSGVWEDLPSDLWAGWLREIGLADSLPALAVEEDRVVRRCEVLAEALERTGAGMVKRWYRLREWLQQHYPAESFSSPLSTLR